MRTRKICCKCCNFKERYSKSSPFFSPDEQYEPQPSIKLAHHMHFKSILFYQSAWDWEGEKHGTSFGNVSQQHNTTTGALIGWQRLHWNTESFYSWVIKKYTKCKWSWEIGTAQENYSRTSVPIACKWGKKTGKRCIVDAWLVVFLGFLLKHEQTESEDKLLKPDLLRPTINIYQLSLAFILPSSHSLLLF